MNRIAASLFAFLFAGAVAFAQTPAPSLEEVAQRVGFSEEAVARAANGEVVSESLTATSDKDLALAVCAKIDAPLQAVYDFVDADKLSRFQTVTISGGEIDPANPSLAGMKLQQDTLKKLATDPGGLFYMSEAEAQKVGEAGKNGTAAALAAYREVLAARAKAYWEQGLEGITPYAGKGRSPAVDLGHANKAAKAYLKRPELQAEVDAVPAKSPGKAEHKLYWAVQKGRDQEAPVLIHRILYQQDDGKVFVERRFYSGYDYDSLQIVVGMLPTEDGNSLIVYTNHTYTSQVAGFGGSAKRSIGAKLLEKDLVAELQRAQKTNLGG
jgi:hypothetical protein